LRADGNGEHRKGESKEHGAKRVGEWRTGGLIDRGNWRLEMGGIGWWKWNAALFWRRLNYALVSDAEGGKRADSSKLKVRDQG